MISVRRLEGKRLLCRAGRHEIITDRKPEDGGSDTGCSSGELLLLAIGSCATGSIRTHLENNDLASDDLTVEVDLVPTRNANERDALAIVVTLSDAFPAQQIGAVEQAAVSGGVVSRIALGSKVNVTVVQKRELG